MTKPFREVLNVSLGELIVPASEILSHPKGWQVICGVTPAVGAHTGKESTVSMKPTVNLHEPDRAVERIDFAREVGYILQQLFTCSLLCN
jgi:hypothetical protein